MEIYTLHAEKAEILRQLFTFVLAMITFCCLSVNYRLDKFNGTNDVRIKLKHHKLLPGEHFLRYAGRSQYYRLSVKSGTPRDGPNPP